MYFISVGLSKPFGLFACLCIAWCWPEGTTAPSSTRTFSAGLLTQLGKAVSGGWGDLMSSAASILGKSYSNKYEGNDAESISVQLITNVGFDDKFCVESEKWQGWKERFFWAKQNGTCGKSGFIQHSGFVVAVLSAKGILRGVGHHRIFSSIHILNITQQSTRKNLLSFWMLSSARCRKWFAAVGVTLILTRHTELVGL